MIFILFIFLFTSCTTLKPPVWVKEFGTRTFSKDGLEGIGFAKFDKKDKSTLSLARQAAYNEAIKNLAVKLKTEVKGELEHKMSDKISYINKKYKQEATDQIDSLTEVLFNTILGRKYFEEYIDYKNSLYWVYVWTTKSELNRVIAEEMEKQEIKNAAIMKSCMKLLKDAEEQVYKNDLISAVKLLNQVLTQLAEIKGISIVNDVDNVSLYMDAKNKLDKLLTSVKISAFGETQIVVFRKTNIDLELTVECKLLYDGKILPVAGIPLKLNFVKGTGETDKIKYTDNTGVAKFKIYKLDTKENVIEILPDTEELTKELPQVDHLKNVKCVFYITAKSLRETKKLLVKIKPGKESFSSELLISEIVSRLRNVDFNITKVLPADYLLEVDMETEYLGDKVSLPDGTLKSFAEIYSGSVSVELKDFSTNDIILSKSFVGLKGFGKTKKEAEENVIKKLAESVAEYIDKNFVQ